MADSLLLAEKSRVSPCAQYGAEEVTGTAYHGQNERMMRSQEKREKMKVTKSWRTWRSQLLIGRPVLPDKSFSMIWRKGFSQWMRQPYLPERLGRKCTRTWLSSQVSHTHNSEQTSTTTASNTEGREKTRLLMLRPSCMIAISIPRNNSTDEGNLSSIYRMPKDGWPKMLRKNGILSTSPVSFIESVKCTDSLN